MKNEVVLLMVSVLMLISTVHADYSIFAVTDASAVNPVNPDIDGDWIVWADDRNGSATTDIYGYTLAEPNEVPVCVYSGEQEFPAVSGRYAVWQDYRNSKREIRVFDLLNRNEPTFSNLTFNNTFDKRNPDISGDIIVWQDYRNGDTDIYMYNIASDTEEAVFNDGDETWGQYYPAIDGDRVVWQDTRHGNYQTYMCIVGGSPERVSVSTENQWRPAVSGNLIVWEEIDGSGNVTLTAYNLAVSGITWTHPVPGTQANLAVSNGIIVWQEDNGSDYDIRGYDTSTGAYLDIATANQDDKNPAISGRRVVWQRNGTDIVDAEIPLPTVLQVDAPVSGEMFLASPQTRIDIAWHLAEGTFPDFVDVEYSLNNGSDWTLIESGIDFADHGYTWSSIPDVNEIDSCRIRITDTSDSTISGISGVFSIFQCRATLTADLTGDCFVDIEDIAELARQWLVCGNPNDPLWCLNQ